MDFCHRGYTHKITVNDSVSRNKYKLFTADILKSKLTIYSECDFVQSRDSIFLKLRIKDSINYKRDRKGK